MLKIALFAALLGGSAAAQTPAATTTPAAAAPQQVFVVAYSKGPRFDPAVPLMRQASVAEHMAHIRSIAPRVIGASPVEPSDDDLLGYVVFHAPDRAAAQAWMKTDPAVVSGTMSARLHRWGVPRIKAWQAAPAGAPQN